MVPPCSSDSKESAFNVGDLSSVPGLGRSPGEGNGNPPQYSCLENSMDRGASWATVHGIAESWTGLSDQHLLINISKVFIESFIVCNQYKSISKVLYVFSTRSSQFRLATFQELSSYTWLAATIPYKTVRKVWELISRLSVHAYDDCVSLEKQMSADQPVFLVLKF